MELRSVEELMDLLYACRGVRDTPEGSAVPGIDLHDHALQTAALLRRSRPADKELQLAGLVHPIGQLLCPTDPTARDEDGRAAGFDAGVLEDWRTVLELVAERNSRLGAVD